MSNLSKTHKTRLKNCKGQIFGDDDDLKDGNTFVHWCPTKKMWVTNKNLIDVPSNEIKFPLAYMGNDIIQKIINR